MKKFFRILKTDEEVATFKYNAQQMQSVFESIRGLRADAMQNNDLEKLEEITTTVKEKLEKMAGICRSSLTYHSNHTPKDGEQNDENFVVSRLSEESVINLKAIQKSFMEEISANDFALEQLHDRKEIEALANGSIFAAVSETEKAPADEAAPEIKTQKEG